MKNILESHEITPRNIKWITGLRAFSFLLVFIYHLEPQLIPKGFIGVDIFFVISGFVISKQLNENWNGKFTGNFLPFYYGRIRRIIPTLYLVLTVVLIAIYLNPALKIVENYRSPITWIVASISNVFFWTRTNYFTDDQSLQPWIHTWSLGVEEQFYLFFPVTFIVLLIKNSKFRKYTITTGVLAGIILTAIIQEQHPTSAFYLLPFRFWEFLIGSLAWEFSNRTNSKIAATIYRRYLFGEYIVLAILILLSLGYLSDSEGLLLEVGTCLATFYLLINWNHVGHFKGFLELRFAVWVGALSYQLYVWHQPIIVWISSSTQFKNKLSVIFGVTVATFIFSYLTRIIVENIKKDYTVNRLRILMLIMGVWSGALVAIQHLPINVNSFENSPEVKKVSQEKIEKAYKSGECFISSGSNPHYGNRCIPKSAHQILIWGDSHAAALASGYLASKIPIRQQTYGSCPALLTGNKLKVCSRNNRLIFSGIDEKVDVIMLHADWRQYWGNEFDGKLEFTLGKLSTSFPDKQIVIIGQVPLWKPRPLLLEAPPELQVSRKYLFNYNSNYDSTRNINLSLSKIAHKSHARFIDPNDYLCKQNKECISFIKSDGKYMATSNDGSHLNPITSIFLVHNLNRALFSLQ